MEERGAIVLALKEGLDQLQISHRDLVQLEDRGVLLKFEGIDVQGFVLLRCAHVMQDGTGGDGGGEVSVEAEAFQGPDVELALDQGHGEVTGPNPVLNAGAGRNALEIGPFGGAGGKEDFAGAGQQKLVYGLLAGGGGR